MGPVEPEKPEGPSSIEALARGAGQGVSLGFADELAGSQAVPYEIGQRIRSAMGGQRDSEEKSLADTYRGMRDKYRGADAAAEKAHPLLFNGAELAGGLAIPVPGGSAVKGASLASKVGRGALAAGTMGTVIGAGKSEAEDIGGVAKDALTTGAVAAPMGATGAAAGHGLGKLGERFGAKAAGAETQLRADTVAEKLASARGEYGQKVQDANRALENLRTALADPASSPKLKADIQSFMQTPGYSQLVEQVGQNTLEAAPLKLGQMSALKQGVADAPALANKAIDEELAKSTLKEDVLPRVMHYAKPAVAALIGGAVGGPTGAGAGGLLGAASGKPGRAIANLMAKPRFQIQANQALESGAEALGEAASRGSPMVSAEESEDLLPYLRRRFAGH